MTKDLISHLRKAAKHSYLGRLLLEEAADCIEGLQTENDKLNAAIKRQLGAAKTLRASIMAEVQHLKDMDRGEYFASKSLDSEREANSILTAERDAWKARAEAAEAKLRKAVGALGDISNGEPEWPDDPQKELDWCRNRATTALAGLNGGTHGTEQ